ncbi:MAG: NAD(P)(+) transhydrogenase (Re/Si-specific) subunit beta, partial [Clostridia bacterium]|nr:NAD(P)(+) transhydrogenase (Re/Si-specific) subunit beta [Clostridia bacterium]
MLTDLQFYVVSGVLVAGILAGLILMSKPDKARYGNAISALCTLIAIGVTLYHYDVLSSSVIWVSVAIGLLVSAVAVIRVKMIQMPQVVALLNGFGGLASALVAILSAKQSEDGFSFYTAYIALVIGFVTFTGSLVAAGKLQKILPQKPVVLKGHTVFIVLLIAATVVCVVLKAPLWAVAILSAL